MQYLRLITLVVCLSATTTASKMTFSTTTGTVTPALTSAVTGLDPTDDHDVMFTNSLDLTNDTPTITQLMDHIRTLEINSHTHLADFEALKQDKLVKDRELAALQQDKLVKDQELAALQQDKLVKDRELAALQQDKLVKDGKLASLESEMQAKDSQISNLTNHLHTEQSVMKQEFGSLKQDSTINNATIKSIELEIQNNSGLITGLGHKTEILTNQLTAMHTEYSSSYNALSKSINASSHIETGLILCDAISPGANETVNTTFSSPYTSAPPTVYVSVGQFAIQVTTNTSKDIGLYGELGDVGLKGFIYICETESYSSWLRYQYMSWISIPA